MVVNQIKMEEEDKFDVLFWKSKSVYERLSEVSRLRKKPLFISKYFLSNKNGQSIFSKNNVKFINKLKPE
jgi:hypothetical protein